MLCIHLENKWRWWEVIDLLCLQMQHGSHLAQDLEAEITGVQGWTDHLETRALPEGPGCPWYLFHRLF
ncbi:unnamed protein product [Staurois parvus]|uniref:Uncharacterized protein n=1 Tax=Staurois parvus TaxID=386267 RepID=A0ABN9D5K1_9NEOB|nr:unnamed protein product [Staurois parvus]